MSSTIGGRNLQATRQQVKTPKLSILAVCTIVATLPCLAQSSKPSPQQRASMPEAVVTRLYREIVVRKPLGIPEGKDKAAIAPYLSKELINRLETAHACQNDYFRQHHKKDSKPEFPWLEVGLFSGGNEEGIPSSAVIEHKERQKDGSFRVYVRLTYKESFQTYGRTPDPANTFSWNVAAIVKPEDGHFAVDDIVQFESNSKKEFHLADAFEGCEGQRWVGYKETELDGAASSEPSNSCLFDFERGDTPHCINAGKAGELFITKKYLSELNYDNGLAAVLSPKHGWMYVNREGKVLITGVARMENGADSFHDGLVRFVKDKKYGFADRTGRVIIPATYDGALNFEHGVAKVCNGCRDECVEAECEHHAFVGGEWYSIDVKGNIANTSGNSASVVTSSEVSQALIGKQITIRGTFSLRGKIGPYVLLGNQQVVYLDAVKGSFTWGKPYSEMEGKLVAATGTLRFFHSPDSEPKDQAIARPVDYFYFEAETARLRLISQ